MGAKLTSGSSAGFSLIELLVVIAVLSVLTIGTVLATGRGGSGDETDMTRFRESFTTMQALAVQGREQRGLVVQGKGLRHARLGADGWDISKMHSPWQRRIAFIRQGERFIPGAPDIRFLPNGRTSAFSIDFARGGRCESNGWAGLTCAVR